MGMGGAEHWSIDGEGNIEMAIIIRKSEGKYENEENRPVIKYLYDLKTGNLIKEENNLNGANLCE
jgi:hypothetical protein